MKPQLRNKPLIENLHQTHQHSCPSCGSSDAVTMYYLKEDKKDFHHSHCYACEHQMWPKRNPDTMNAAQQISEEQEEETAQFQPSFTPVIGNYEDIPSRGLTKETCKKYGLMVRRDAEGKPQDFIFNYYDQDGNLVAQKLRSVKNKEIMRVNGKVKDAGLFGQQAFPAGGKYVTVMVGEFDAPSGFQMQGSKWPCVSVKNGDQSAIRELRKEQVWKWLNTFDNIVLCFDADESGQAAVNQIIQEKVFDFNKLKVMKLRKKDASEYLQGKLESEFVKDFWDSSKYIPKNILRATDLKNLALEHREHKAVPYAWDGLNELLHGIFSPQLITLTAGSGVGKSCIMKHLTHYLLKSTSSEVNIGMLMLEEPVRDTLRGLMTIELGKNLNLEEVPDSGVTVSDEEKEQAWNEVFKGDRLYLYGDFGSNLIDQIVTDVTYMAQALQCKYIFLDHISIIVAGQDNGDERKALDEIIVKLRELCHTLDITIFIVCHTKRVIGKPHEEGGQTSLSDLRGTAGIGQMSDVVIGIERDGQHDNPFIRDTTIIRVLKNRRFGRTGPAAYLKYEHMKGTVDEIDKETFDAELAKDMTPMGAEQEKPVFDNTRAGVDGVL